VNFDRIRRVVLRRDFLAHSGSSTYKWDNGIYAINGSGTKIRTYAKAHFA